MGTGGTQEVRVYLDQLRFLFLQENSSLLSALGRPGADTDALPGERMCAGVMHLILHVRTRALLGAIRKSGTHNRSPQGQH